MFRNKTADDCGNGLANENNRTAPPGSPAHPVRAGMASGPVSCIGAGMSIVGNVECSGSAHVYGRIEGELRASDLLIGEGAQIQGSVIAQEVTVRGSVKGTIRALRVVLQGGAVEGDIFNRSLLIDESSVFEGASRREENLAERGRQDGSSNLGAKAGQKKTVESPPLVSSPLSIDAAVHKH